MSYLNDAWIHGGVNAISNEQKWDMAYDRMKYLYETLQYESRDTFYVFFLKLILLQNFIPNDKKNNFIHHNVQLKLSIVALHLIEKICH